MTNFFFKRIHLRTKRDGYFEFFQVADKYASKPHKIISLCEYSHTFTDTNFLERNASSEKFFQFLDLNQNLSLYFPKFDSLK